MQRAEELYRDGRLTEAIGSLQTYLRDHPTETRARSFLFELLCFAGEWKRAGKQLVALGAPSKESKLGITFYLAALGAEEERQAYYSDTPEVVSDSALPPSRTPAGCWNGKRFTGIRDLDSRLGESLEFFSAGRYHRIGYRYLKRLEIQKPARVRDLCWVRANAETSPEAGGRELDSILIPALYPQTWRSDDDLTRLGRNTDWVAAETGEIPLGQRILVIGDEEVPLLSVSSIEFDKAPEPEESAGV